MDRVYHCDYLFIGKISQDLFQKDHLPPTITKSGVPQHSKAMKMCIYRLGGFVVNRVGRLGVGNRGGLQLEVHFLKTAYLLKSLLLFLTQILPRGCVTEQDIFNILS